jgi:hypothetical protein
MESDRAYLGAAILIAMLVFSNLIIYGIVRGVSRDTKGANFMKTMQDMMRNPLKKENDPFDELRKKVEELESKKKKDTDSNVS